MVIMDPYRDSLGCCRGIRWGSYKRRNGLSAPRDGFRITAEDRKSRAAKEAERAKEARSGKRAKEAEKGDSP
ncbi:hypothetical protein [Paenibacillus jamilae]|uniref:hypothetical protein n=1 Tax=Paenibacillus jamilae TaxID=114136 RepID=UPI000AE85A75|nr:hypothetical protein [Paenibacillus jamilae]